MPKSWLRCAACIVLGIVVGFVFGTVVRSVVIGIIVGVIVGIAACSAVKLLPLGRK